MDDTKSREHLEAVLFHLDQERQRLGVPFEEEDPRRQQIRRCVRFSASLILRALEREKLLLNKYM